MFDAVGGGTLDAFVCRPRQIENKAVKVFLDRSRLCFERAFLPFESLLVKKPNEENDKRDGVTEALILHYRSYNPYSHNYQD